MQDFARRWMSVALALLGFGLLGLPAAAEDPPSDSTASEAAPQAEDDPLAEQVDKAIAITSRRYLDVDVHTPWQMMHGVLALREEFQVKRDGEKINAIEWISTTGPTYRGESWFQKTRYGGRAHPYNGDFAFEGHANQFLAIFALAGLPPEHEFKTPEGGTITIADMVRHTQQTVTDTTEPTWTLWALAHYLGPEATWTNNRNERWSVERLARLQTAEPVTRGACGGTHGLFALAYARNLYLQTGKPLEGIWRDAHNKVVRYANRTRSYQNSDGSFSSSFFEGQSYARNLEDRLHSTGHTLEFLMMALPQQRLEEEWIRRAVAALANDLIENRARPIDCGPLYHTLNALVIYRDRTAPPPETVQEQDTETEDEKAPTEEPKEPEKAAAVEAAQTGGGTK